MEVIYTGLRQTPEMIAQAALQEDVDVIGLSILSGAHMALTPQIMELLKTNGQTDVHVFIGGIVPDEDVPRLKLLGHSSRIRARVVYRGYCPGYPIRHGAARIVERRPTAAARSARGTARLQDFHLAGQTL